MHELVPLCSLLVFLVLREDLLLLLVVVVVLLLLLLFMSQCRSVTYNFTEQQYYLGLLHPTVFHSVCPWVSYLTIPISEEQQQQQRESYILFLESGELCRILD